MRPRRSTLAGITALAALSTFLAPAVAGAPSQAAAAPHDDGHSHHHASAALIVDGLEGTIGSTIGPDGALYVPESVLGQITRVDLRTGETSTFADGLPPRIGDLGGAMDVAFV